MSPRDILREDHGQIMKLCAAWQKMLVELDHTNQLVIRFKLRPALKNLNKRLSGRKPT